jgi:membrane-associated phospholipid phosphatase
VKRWKHQLLKMDASLSKAMHVDHNNKWVAWILKFFAHSGDSWFWLAGLLITWLVSAGEWRQRAVYLAFSLVVMAGAVIALKFSIRRPRPEGEWGQIYRITDPHSFPSGHAARSTTLAVMALAIGPPWFAIALVIWSPWVGISRVALGVHYLSDVVAGWLVGAVMGLIAVALHPWAMQMLSFLF